MNKKEKSELIQKAIELMKNRQTIIEKETALKTVESNIPTNKELTEYWDTFGFNLMIQYQLVKTFSLLEYLAQKVDNLGSQFLDKE